MRKTHVIWGLLLIITGIVWILASTGTIQLSIDIIGAISTLWPIFIVAAGVTILLKKEAHTMRAVVWIIAAAIVIGYGIFLGSDHHGIAGAMSMSLNETAWSMPGWKSTSGRQIFA